MPKNVVLILVILLIAALVLPGCIVQTPNKYAGTSKNVTINEKDRRQFKVLANKAWQKPGIYLVPGAKVSIRANGKWSPWPEIGMSCGAEGDSTASIAGEVAWIPLCALMARLGNSGRPFLVGPVMEFTAEETGHLFFAMNDPFNFLHNNTGALLVSVTIEYPESPASTTNDPAQ